jgi:hypothetical protein
MFLSIKKLYFLGLMALCSLALRSATKPFVYDTTTGNAPSVNKIYRDFYIYVDMSPSPYSDSKYCSDFEIKVIDQYRNTLYFSATFSLNNSTYVNGHSNITDSSPTIYYFSTAGSGDYNRCFGQRVQFSNYKKSSIGASIGSNTVTGVWFYPSLDANDIVNVPEYTGFGQYSKTRNVKRGDYIREIFTDPNNTIIVWRQNMSTAETLPGGVKRWISILPTYYGDSKVKL